ncbi:reverse transcriptase domain-containing protein [Tanacetum coccineum]
MKFSERPRKINLRPTLSKRLRNVVLLAVGVIPTKTLSIKITLTKETPVTTFDFKSIRHSPVFPPVQYNHNVQKARKQSESLQPNTERLSIKLQLTTTPVHQGQLYRPQVVQTSCLFQLPPIQAPTPQNFKVYRRSSRYTANYNHHDGKYRIDVIDMACEEYSQEVLGFSKCWSQVAIPLLTMIPLSLLFLTLTPLGTVDFLLFEKPTLFLALEDDPTSPEVESNIFMTLMGTYFPSKQFLIVIPHHHLPIKEIIFRKLEKILVSEAKHTSVNEPPELNSRTCHLILGISIFGQSDDQNCVIIAKDLKNEEKAALIEVLKSHKRAIVGKLSDSRDQPRSMGKSSVAFCNKKGGMTVVTKNVENDCYSTRWSQGGVYASTIEVDGGYRKDHFPLPFMDQMLERLAGNQFYYFLDGFSGYFQIPIDPKDQEKTTFTCPYGTFAYRRMPFGLCNAPGTFQRCMMAIFHDMIKKTMEVFMDDFSVFGDSFSTCLSHLDKMLKRCEDTNLVLNWEKSHFMVKEGIVLGPQISKSGIEVDRAKVDVIAKLPHPTTVKGVRSFLGHAGFYRRFIQDFSKISRPMTHLLEKETPFFFSKECIEYF